MTVRSERVVRTLAQADPEFVELCKVLYGDVVDPDTVWAEAFGVSKAAPDQTDLASRRQRREDMERRVAQASNVLGLTAGSAAIGQAASSKEFDNARWARGVRTATGRAGKVVPTGVKRNVSRATNKVGARRLAYAGLGLQTANVAGDVVTARVLGAKKPVEKIALPKLVQGKVAQMKTMLRPTGGTSPAGPTNPGQKAIAAGTPGVAGNTGSTDAFGRGQQVRNAASAALGTPKRKAVAGGIAGTAALGAGGAAVSGRNKGQSGGYYEPYYYGKRDVDDVVWGGEISKFDDDKRLAFGWASVTEVNGQPVVDRQGDYIAIDDIEAAAYTYVQKSRVGGDMHRRNGDQPHKVGEIVESVVFTPEKIEKMGLPSNFPKGWWVGFKVDDDATWAEVKKGGRTGFSIHGKGVRKDIGYDSLMTGQR